MIKCPHTFAHYDYTLIKVTHFIFSEFIPRHWKSHIMAKLTEQGRSEDRRTFNTVFECYYQMMK